MKRKYDTMELSVVLMEEDDVFLQTSGENGGEPDAIYPESWYE